MRQNDSDRRAHPRLSRRYPVRVLVRGEGPDRQIDHAPADDLSPEGARFTTAHGDELPVGTDVTLELSIPHLFGGRDEVTLSLRGEGRVVRRTGAHDGCYGEDGRLLHGVAVHLDRPFSLQYEGGPS